MNSTENALNDIEIDYFTITAVQTGGSDEAPSAGGTDTPGTDEPGTDTPGTDEPGTDEPGAGDTTTATTKYYTFKDVTKSSGYGFETLDVDPTTGALTIGSTATQSYAQVGYTFPAGVDTSTIKDITFHFAEGNGAGFGVKFFAESPNSNWDNYEQIKWGADGTITITAEEALSMFVFMNKDNAVLDGIVIDYFTITAVQTGGSDKAPSTETEPDDGTGDDTNPDDDTTGGDDAGDDVVTGDPTTKYYTFNDVTRSSGYGYVENISDAGGLSLSLTGQYQEIMYTLPEGVAASTLSEMKFYISAGDVSNLAIKVYADGTQAQVEYEKDTITVTADLSEASKVTFGLMNKGEEAADFVIDYFTITAVQTGGSDEVPEVSEPVETYTADYTAEELGVRTSGADSCEKVNGNYVVKFTELNQEVVFTLPEIIDLDKCISIKFTVASQNGPVNFFVNMDGTKLKSYWYNVDKNEYVVAPEISNKINAIGIQSGGETFTEGAFIELVGVSFIMEGKEPLPTPEDGVYTYSYFEEAQMSDGVTIVKDETDDSATITFPTKGDSITLAIPASVDVNHLVFVNFKMEVSATTRVRGVLMARMVAANTAEPDVLVEILDADKQPIVSTLEDSVETKCNPEVAYIRFTATADNTVLDLTSIEFVIDEEAFESIVLNGSFAREDVSMWGAALWGSVDGVDTTITAEVSDTPVWGDSVYTYGHLSKRSSRYVCFAQDITDRVTPGKWYDVGFSVRLSAEDYKDAGASMRTVTCAPYYLDGNGNPNYSRTPYGQYSIVAEPGVWTSVVCKVYVPLDTTGYILRIMEQGTKYGGGNCLMGSYDVSTVVMAECDAPPQQTYSNGGGGGSVTNTTVTKEATWTGDYNMEDMAIDWASATATKNGATGLNITFDNNYDEVRLKLPRALDMSTAAYVKALVSSQNVPLAVKLYYKGKEVDVGYYNNINNEYTLVPKYTGMIDAIGIMSLATPNPADAYVNFENIIFGLTEEPAPIVVSNDIVQNGNFASDDLSDWMAAFWGDGVTMTQHTGKTAIAPGVYNYASYSKRTSPYQCFAQDITDRVEAGETYTFSFWAKLSEDYKGAPESQRIIQFAPYTTDSDGVSDYNPKLEGTYLQICEPGVWTYFEGTYKVTNPNDVSKVVIRILEQGTNYGQGECVLGRYSVADVKMEKYVPEPPSIDVEVPDLKDAMTEVFGEDFIVGTAATIDELDDIGVEMLINKHFNAVTLGNELKPDALFNYSNGQHTALKTITFNGVEMEVPTLSFYRADQMLDTLLKWNKDHPESPLKVRGHVLVWHSQTPEWFFREGYEVKQNADGTENYVTPEVMNLRLEWYIKTVLEHYVGEDSPYKDLFYGWDVVNEAVSNGGGYRTDKVSAIEAAGADTHSNNSSWWAVYQSNEFIINAFKYANTYAPAELELYYNDYNECDTKKSQGIVQLLKDVKEAEGTRIDGMGMQAHYNMFSPGMKAFEAAIRAYAEVVDSVQITEWDIKASGSIDTESNKNREYKEQGARYRDFYEVLKALKEEGINISGVTFWGTVDHHSWLQESSTVGGGADGEMTQCPLLFSDDYKVKPSYWAFVDYSVIDPDYVAPTLVGAKDEEEQKPEEEKPATGEDKTEEQQPSTEATPAPEKEEQQPSSEAPVASDKTEEKESNNVVPIAVGGGVAGVGIIGAIVAFLKKRKKNIAE